jgi:hypothetical protein
VFEMMCGSHRATLFFMNHSRDVLLDRYLWPIFPH